MSSNVEAISSNKLNKLNTSKVYPRTLHFVSRNLKLVMNHSLFMPHGHCYLWKDDLVILHVLSDSVISLSYFVIPIVMLSFALRKKDAGLNKFIWLYIAFIFLCGLTHVNEIINLWHSYYYYSGIIKLITAIISVATVVELIKNKRKILLIPSPEQLINQNRKLETLNDELDKIVEKKTRDLRTSNKMLMNYASWVSHDLKEPIRNILNHSKLLEQKIDEQNPEEQKKFLKFVVDNGHRMERIVGSLLDLAKIQNTPISHQQIDLKLMLESLINIHEGKKIECSIHIEDNFEIFSDVSLFERILSNLISNAVKYSADVAVIEIHAWSEGALKKISIKDYGKGIKKTALGFIFHPRFTSGDENSFGIGLALTKAICDNLNIKINVESEYGVGSIFTLTLDNKIPM